MTIEHAFGARIQTLRRSQGLSQEKFSLSIGMDRSYYASVEAGRRNISIRNIERIARGLNIRISELFAGMEQDGAAHG